MYEWKGVFYGIYCNHKIPDGELVDYKRKNYVPAVDLSISNFDVFLEKREKLLIQKLETELRKG